MILYKKLDLKYDVFRYQKVVIDFTFIKHSIIFCLMVHFYSYHCHCHQTLPFREFCNKNSRTIWENIGKQICQTQFLHIKLSHITKQIKGFLIIEHITEIINTMKI